MLLATLNGQGTQVQNYSNPKELRLRLKMRLQLLLGHEIVLRSGR